MAFANAGFDVTVVDASEEALARGLATIRRNYDSSVRRGRLDAAEAGARLARIRGSSDLDDLAAVDITVEAIFEDMQAKLDLLDRLERIVQPRSIIATNTSTLDVDAMAAGMIRPERFLGMHFFSPANVMKLLEIVRGAATAAETVDAAVALARRLDKIPVVVGVCFGFVGNRMLFARAAESERALLEGSTPAQNDAVLKQFGFPMGQHEMMDLSGLDVEWRIRQPRGEVRPISDALHAMNRWGQKTGAGFYRYEAGARTAIADPEVDALCRETGERLGFPQRDFTDEELLERQLYPLVNEGVRILDEGIASSTEDIDTIWRHGYGWPAEHVGPMAWADAVGISRISSRLTELAETSGNDSLRPARLMERAVGRGISLQAAAREASA